MTPYESSVSDSSPPISRTTAFDSEATNRDRSVDLPAPRFGLDIDNLRVALLGGGQALFEYAQLAPAPYEADRCAHGGYPDGVADAAPSSGAHSPKRMEVTSPANLLGALGQVSLKTPASSRSRLNSVAPAEPRPGSRAGRIDRASKRQSQRERRPPRRQVDAPSPLRLSALGYTRRCYSRADERRTNSQKA